MLSHLGSDPVETDDLFCSPEVMKMPFWNRSSSRRKIADLRIWKQQQERAAQIQECGAPNPTARGSVQPTEG